MKNDKTLKHETFSAKYIQVGIDYCHGIIPHISW